MSVYFYFLTSKTNILFPRLSTLIPATSTRACVFLLFDHFWSRASPLLWFVFLLYVTPIFFLLTFFHSVHFSQQTSLLILFAQPFTGKSFYFSFSQNFFISAQFSDCTHRSATNRVSGTIWGATKWIENNVVRQIIETI